MPESGYPGGKCCAVHTQHPASLCWSLGNIQPSLNLWARASRSVFEDKQLPVIWVKEVTCKTALFSPLFFFFLFFFLFPPHLFHTLGLSKRGSKGTAVPCVQTTWGTTNCKGSSVGWGALEVSQEDGITSMVRADAVIPISSLFLTQEASLLSCTDFTPWQHNAKTGLFPCRL